VNEWWVAAQPTAESFAVDAVRELYRTLLADLAFGVSRDHGISSRIKTSSAIKAKLHSSDLDHSINDFIGIRVLAGHSRCIGEIENKVSEWAINLGMVKVRREDYFMHPDISGYKAIHLDYRFRNPEQQQLPPEAGVEVQITTWLQHLHSMLSHRLFYKAIEPPDKSTVSFLQSFSQDLSKLDAKLAEFLYHES